MDSNLDEAIFQRTGCFNHQPTWLINSGLEEEFLHNLDAPRAEQNELEVQQNTSA